MVDEEKFYPPAIKRGDTQYGDGYTEALFARLNELDPEYSMMFQKFIHGGLYDRDIIDHKSREFCAISALCVTGRFNQMRSHFTAAASYGASNKEVLEVILQMSTYIGVPSVLEAIKVYQEWASSGGAMAGYGTGD